MSCSSPHAELLLTITQVFQRNSRFSLFHLLSTVYASKKANFCLRKDQKALILGSIENNLYNGEQLKIGHNISRDTPGSDFVNALYQTELDLLNRHGHSLYNTTILQSILKNMSNRQICTLAVWLSQTKVKMGSLVAPCKGDLEYCDCSNLVQVPECTTKCEAKCLGIMSLVKHVADQIKSGDVFLQQHVPYEGNGSDAYVKNNIPLNFENIVVQLKCQDRMQAITPETIFNVDLCSWLIKGQCSKISMIISLNTDSDAYQITRGSYEGSMFSIRLLNGKNERDFIMAPTDDDNLFFTLNWDLNRSSSQQTTP
jgi:hypothetical protein